MSAAEAEKTPYRTTEPRPPEPANEGPTEEPPKGHPLGLYFLFGTEMWERFSYYGMRALLVLYMIKIHGWQPQDSSSVYKWYTSLVYLTPLLGGFLADRYLGLRTAIIVGGILMAVGHFLMAFEPLPMFYAALAFLIAGNGFFKPNISTLVGKMYRKGDPRRDGGFTIFYMGINLGAFMAPLICGQWLRASYGFHYGFGAAGVGMVIGLVTFLVGQKWIRKAVSEAGNTMEIDRPIVVPGAPPEAPRLHPLDRPEDNVPPHLLGDHHGGGILPRERNYTRTAEDETLPPATGSAGIVAKVMPFLMLAIAVVVPVRCIYVLATGHDSLKGVFMPIAFSLISGLMGYVLLTIKGAARDKSIVIFVLFFFVVLFWMAFEQAGNALNLWAEFFTQRKLAFFNMEAEAYQSINAIGIVILGPLFAWMWLRLARSGREPSTPLKMAIAMVFVALSFVAMAGAAVFENQGETRVHLAKTALVKSIDITKLDAGRLSYDEAREELVVRGVLASYVVNDVLTKAAAPEYLTSVERLVEETQSAKTTFPYVGKLERVPEGADPSKLDEKLHAKWEDGRLLVTEPVDAANKTKLLGLGAPPEWRQAFETLREKSDSSRVTGFWLFLSYLLATIGELCLSPVGLSMVTKLAPARFASLFMGVWMLASSVAQYAGGSIGESWGQITPSTYFNLFVLSSAIGAVILVVLVYPLKRLMHNAT
jgi:POT family proton-dependent oligopeptide transporter